MNAMTDKVETRTNFPTSDTVVFNKQTTIIIKANITVQKVYAFFGHNFSEKSMQQMQTLYKNS